MAEKSAQHPMPSLVHADRVIDELYRENPNQPISKSRIVEAASKAPIVPDVMVYFTHLPDRSYTKQDLIETLNRAVKARHREAAVGLFGVGTRAPEARREAEKKEKRA